MKNKINIDEISYPSGNLVDPFGRVFFKGDKVFRSVSKEYVDFCHELLDSGLINELTEKKLIPRTIISEYEIDDYSMVLEHERVGYTRPSEWIFSMFKDAGLAILEINNICKKYGYCLKDAHPWNITFKNNKPIFLDLGSIVRIDDRLDKFFEQEFKNTILYPLILWSKNEDLLAQAVLSNPANMYKFTIPKATLSDSRLINGLLSSLGEAPEMEENYIKKICISKSEDTMWKEYQDEFFLDLKENKLCKRFQRFKKIKELLGEFSSDAKSVVDLAGNMGAMAYYLEIDGKYERIITVDYDENAVEISYKRFKEIESETETYLLNFMLPKNHEVFEYFKSDIVLGLAVTHHLILTQNFSLEFIFDRMAAYSKKYVYIEFMPLGLWGGGELPKIPSWYTEDWFEKMFAKKFNLIHKEQLEKNRVIFIGEIKNYKK